MLTMTAVGLAACGGGGGEETASTGTSLESTAPTSGPPETAARRPRLPGPPGPVGPLEIVEAIEVWHPLAEAGVPGGDCRPLLGSVQGRLGDEAAEVPGGRPYVALYRGIAEGCLGRLQAARQALTEARQVGLGPDETSTDRTCNAQLLLAFGFATYLNQEISPRCPVPTTTRATTTTTRATTTTRRPSTTTRASTSTTR